MNTIYIQYSSMSVCYTLFKYSISSSLSSNIIGKFLKLSRSPLRSKLYPVLDYCIFAFLDLNIPKLNSFKKNLFVMTVVLCLTKCICKNVKYYNKITTSLPSLFVKCLFDIIPRKFKIKKFE